PPCLLDKGLSPVACKPVGCLTVTAFESPVTGGLLPMGRFLFPDPVLESAQFDLQSAEILVVFLALHRFVGGPHRPRVLFVSNQDSSLKPASPGGPGEGSVFPPLP